METQTTIRTWARDTFGPATTPVILARANTELAELLAAFLFPIPSARLVEEAADVLIVLAQLPDLELLFDGAFIAGRGPTPHTPRSLLLDASDDMGYSLCHALTFPERLLAPLVEDLALGMLDFIVQLGGSPQDAIDAKMAINRGRTWALSGHGTAQHVV